MLEIYQPHDARMAHVVFLPDLFTDFPRVKIRFNIGHTVDCKASNQTFLPRPLPRGVPIGCPSLLSGFLIALPSQAAHTQKTPTFAAIPRAFVQSGRRGDCSCAIAAAIRQNQPENPTTQTTKDGQPFASMV